MFMPEKYARIFLKCTNVKAERAQDISEEDARKEGILICQIQRLCAILLADVVWRLLSFLSWFLFHP